MELPDKQAELLETVKAFISGNGYAPTYKELAVIQGVRINTIFSSLKALKKKGYVDWIEGKSRTLRVIDREGE